jgi:hypothetical protein
MHLWIAEWCTCATCAWEDVVPAFDDYAALVRDRIGHEADPPRVNLVH